MKRPLLPLLFALVMLTLLHAIRFNQGNIQLGSESYYHQRISDHKGFIFNDDYVYSGRLTIKNPYHLLLSLFNHIITPALTARILPMILGLLSILVFMAILKQLGFKEKMILAASLLVAMSPTFLYSFGVSTTTGMAVLFQLLCIYFLLTGRAVLSASCLVLLIPFGGFQLIAAVVIVSLYFLKTRQRSGLYIAVLGILASSVFIAWFGFGLKAEFVSTSFLKESVSEFGGKSGLSPFFIILAIIGMVTKYRTRSIRFLYAALIFFLALGLTVDPDFNLILGYVLSPIAAVGFFQIIERRWELQPIKNLTIILILCGLMFSAVAYSRRAAESGPDYSVVQGLQWFIPGEGYVFSHYKNGFWIQTIGGKRVLFDEYTERGAVNQNAYNETLQIFYSRNLEVTKGLLDKYGIDYIFIDPVMKHGLVWHEPDEGLLFLFSNNETFKKIYGIAEVELWKYNR